MSANLYAEYPPALNDQQREYLLSNLKDWSIAHGLAVRPAPAHLPPAHDPDGALAAIAPVTLFPSLFPRRCFEQARSVALAYNELYSAIASDEQWLGGIIEELVEVDPFIAELWKVHQAVKREGYAQSVALGLFRSDYMVDVDKADGCTMSVKQVEFNTIASSFGGLSSQVSALHRYLSSIDAYPQELSSTINGTSLPDSASVPSLARGMAKAHEAYGAPKSALPTCVIFLVQDAERNVFDQRHVEYALNQNHGVRTFRLPFHRILQDTTVDDQRSLVYTPPSSPHKHYEVTVVYFRAGYAPTDYTSQAHWDGRLQIERSAAIKCPTVLTQLAGTKKVQQVLATPDSPHVAKFLPHDPRAAEILQTFAPIYPLDHSAAGREALRLATHPDTAVKYVLKPQREGGGNNVYRQDIPAFLHRLPASHRRAYILMEMIEPPAQRNTLFRHGHLHPGAVVCELGVFAACLWDARPDRTRALLDNFHAGFLLRTKPHRSHEGGVAAGFACVDSPCLVDV